MAALEGAEQGLIVIVLEEKLEVVEDTEEVVVQAQPMEGVAALD